MHNNHIEILGLFAGMLGIVAWIPQIMKVWIHKEYKGISLVTMYIVAACIGLWIVYGVLKNAFAVIVCNIFVLSCLFIVIIGIYRCRAIDTTKNRLV